MPTVTLSPATAEYAWEALTPTGLPVTLTPSTAEYGMEAGTGLSDDGPLVYADGHLPEPAALPALGNYVVEVRDIIGGFYTRLTDRFTVTRLTWKLNDQGGCVVNGPALDPNLAALHHPNSDVIDGREIQVSRDDLAGPFNHFVPSPQVDLRDYSITGFDPGFHLGHKFIGRNNDTPNLVVNGDFATDVLDWTGVGVSSLTWNPTGDGGEAVITSTAAGAFYAQQFIDLPAEPFGSFLWLSADITLDAAIDVRDLATSGRALWAVFRTPGGTVVWQQGVSPNWRDTSGAQHIATKIFAPPDQHVIMELRLYSPKGTVRYDNVVMHRSERLNCVGTPSDVIGCLVAHAQDAGYAKSNVNITADNSRGEGTVEVVRRYKFEEAANIWQAMQEMARLRGGVDFLVETPTTNTRTVFCMERIGYDVGDANRVQAVLGANLNTFKWVWNPQKRADIVRVQGRGSGDEVTQAVVNDPDSDLGWESVTYASIEGSTHPELEAQGRANTFKRPQTAELVFTRTATFDVGWNCCPANDGPLLPGRLIDVDFDYGVVHIHEQFKVISTDFEPEWERATVQAIPVAALLDE